MPRVFMLAVLILLCGCQTYTQYGSCIGAFDDRNPKLQYKVSVRNAVVAVVFIEMIVPPIKVIVDESLCPVGPKVTP